MMNCAANDVGGGGYFDDTENNRTEACCQRVLVKKCKRWRTWYGYILLPLSLR